MKSDFELYLLQEITEMRQEQKSRSRARGFSFVASASIRSTSLSMKRRRSLKFRTPLSDHCSTGIVQVPGAKGQAIPPGAVETAYMSARIEAKEARHSAALQW